MSDAETHAIPESAHEAVARLNVSNVRTVHLHAERLAEDGGIGDLEIQTHMAHAVDAGAFANRFTYEVGMLDGDGERVADLEVSIEVHYVVDDDDYVVPADAAEFITATTGLFSAWPYARETLQSLATRLQLDPVVLGLLPRGATESLTATTVTRDGS